jgi:hypothetical protein
MTQTSNANNLTRSHFDYAMLFFVLFATGLGAYLRIVQVAKLNFPLNDGGLFYSMTKDLIANGFRIPAFTTYNSNIPFAYPPLAFYFSGFLSVITGWSLLDIFRILPSVISTLSIPAFYLLANDLLKSKQKTAIATVIFALIPAEWSIMGGGATRSFGLIFSLLTLWSAYRMYSLGVKKYIILAIVFGSMACLSHPETAVHTIASAILFLLFFGRNWRGLIRSVIVVVGVLVCAAPWWVTVITTHGFSPFLSATQTGGYRFDIVLGFIQGKIAQEAFLTFIGCFTVIGLFLELAKKKIFLPVWMIAMVITEPRSATSYWKPVIAMLAAIVLLDLIFPGLRSGVRQISDQISKENWAEELFSGRMVKIIFTFFLAYFIMSAYAIVQEDRRSLMVRPGDIKAFEWVNTNISPNQRFILVTGVDSLYDPTSEWFPALTDENSLATVQGQEWTQGKMFTALLGSSANLQLCVVQDTNCIADWKKKTGLAFDYIYLQKWLVQTQEGESYIDWPLQDSLAESGKYEVVYESDSTVIFKGR